MLNANMPAKSPSEQSSLISEALQPHQDELQKLGELMGIYMNPRVFRIFVDLLNMGVDPNVLFNVLKTIRRSVMHKSKEISTSKA